ncbi:hypothetical protein LPJ61_004650 [Coemansia biformis]|uniref:SDR family oxidoreductase n=1 Tax=Coemansia biformis TaxID=1286918 RepID=A0A9W7Y866_9FUNG|nr:hypothetical protein LPJ61_004650 [Coemansia biformis]
MQISGKVAVITGGARGFGQRLAEAIVERGGRVVVGDVLAAEGAQAVQTLNAQGAGRVAVFQKCDVTRAAELEALVARAVSEFGALDIMVNNAGVGGTVPWTDADHTSAARTISVNLVAPVEGTRLAVHHFMQAGRPGCVVNIASMMAFFPTDYGPVYGATKSGLVNFTAACATLARLSPPIRVNAVAPNFADTAMIRETVPEGYNVLGMAGILTVDEVVAQMIRCIEDETLAGDTIKLLPGRAPLVHSGRKAVDSGIITAAKL